MNHLHHVGRIMHAATACAILAVLGGTTHALPGDLDPGFSVDGLARATVSGTTFTATAAARDRDGRVIVVGDCIEPGRETGFCVTRFNADGSFDNTRGAFGAVSWRPVNPVGPSRPYAVAVDALNRVVVAGHCSTETGGADFCLARLLQDGRPDPGFANANGEVITAIGNGTANDTAFALAIQPDGRILAGGSCRRFDINAFGFCIARYLANGALDTSFGNVGVSMGYFQSVPNGTQDTLRAMTVDATGFIYAVGDCEVSTGMRRMCAMRFPPNGSTQAGAAGAYTVGAAGTPSYANALALQHDGNLIVGGSCSGGATSTGDDFCLIRLTPALLLDTTFGVGGVRRTPIGYQSRSDVVRAIAIQSDGRIIAAGTCGLNPATSGDAFCWARYMSNGEEDRSIHGNTDATGVIATQFTTTAAHDRAVAVMINDDGGILLAGGCESATGSGQYQACVARYQGGPSPSAHCSPDIDGDGRFNPLIDGLIISRIAAGMRDSSVLSGIQLPPTARRRGWNNDNGVASYLAHACGIRDLRYTSLSAAP